MGAIKRTRLGAAIATRRPPYVMRPHLLMPAASAPGRVRRAGESFGASMIQGCTARLPSTMGRNMYFALGFGIGRPGVFLVGLCKTSSTMDLPPPPDDELAQPTRAKLFRLLSELRRPVGTEELAAQLELHVNGVRAHLERLREAGLITRERTRQARGRPRDMWSIAPEAQPGGGPPSAHAKLSQWLGPLGTPRKGGKREGRNTPRGTWGGR